MFLLARPRRGQEHPYIHSTCLLFDAICSRGLEVTCVNSTAHEKRSMGRLPSFWVLEWVLSRLPGSWWFRAWVVQWLARTLILPFLAVVLWSGLSIFQLCSEGKTIKKKKKRKQISVCIVLIHGKCSILVVLRKSKVGQLSVSPERPMSDAQGSIRLSTHQLSRPFLACFWLHLYVYHLAPALQKLFQSSVWVFLQIWTHTGIS